MSSLLANVSSLSTGEDSLVDPADALRNAMTVSGVLEYAPEPESDEELAGVLELKVDCISVFSVFDAVEGQRPGLTCSIEIIIHHLLQAPGISILLAPRCRTGRVKIRRTGHYGGY